MPIGDSLLSAVEHRTRDRSKPRIVKRAKDEHGQQDHWMYQLKMLRHRKPLNLKRIPPLLLANIASRQTGHTMMNLSQISYNMYLIISQILAKMRLFTVFERIRQQFTWKQVIRYHHSITNSLEMRTFRNWIDFLLPMVDWERLSKLDRDWEFVEELQETYGNRDRYELKTIDISSLSSNVLDLIVNRMSFLAALELRQCNRFFQSHVDSALIKYYPASVMLGPFVGEMTKFRRNFKLGLTVNGSCLGIIDRLRDGYIYRSEISLSLLQEYRRISSRLTELNSIKEKRDQVDRYRWKEEWRHLGSIPPTRSIPLEWDPRQLLGPYWV